MSSFLKNLTKREILAFKAGGWASLPMDYALENYVLPYAKKKISEKKFYSHISKMPRKYKPYSKNAKMRRFLTSEPMVISQEDPTTESLKRSGIELLRAHKRAKYSKNSVMGISPEIKCCFQEISTSTQNVGVMRVEQLYNVNQGAERGERIGQKIRAHYIDVRGFLYNQSTSLSTVTRILFVQDKKPQLGATTTNLFQAEGSDNIPVDYGTGGDLAQVTKKINLSRYRVLSDRRFKLNPFGNHNSKVLNLNYRVQINRNIDYLSDATLKTDTEKISPNIFCLLFFEVESGTTGVNLLKRDIQLYQYFSG